MHGWSDLLKVTQSKRDKDPELLALNPAKELQMRESRWKKPSEALQRLLSEEWWLGECLIIYWQLNPWPYLQCEMKNKMAELWTTRRRPCPGSLVYLASPWPGGLHRFTPSLQSSDFKTIPFYSIIQIISKFKFYSLKLASKVSMKMFFQQVSKTSVYKVPNYMSGTVLSTLIY